MVCTERFNEQLKWVMAYCIIMGRNVGNCAFRDTLLRDSLQGVLGTGLVLTSGKDGTLERVQNLRRIVI